MTKPEWIKACADQICKFYGEGARRQAEQAAQYRVEMQSTEDDPIGEALLIMEGWSS